MRSQLKWWERGQGTDIGGSLNLWKLLDGVEPMAM